MDLQGLAQFGNVPVDSVVSATYTHAHGISPGVCSFTVTIGTPISIGGDLRFTFGIEQVVFPDCRADLANIELTGDGHHWQVQILDRRWKWRFGEANGFFNRRDDRKNVIASSEKTPQELATILLDAMGETGSDVSAIPNGPRPLMEWVSANPAEELARLCDELGCRIVLHLDNSVKIHRIGVGGQLAGIVPGVTMSSGRGIDPPEKPDAIKVIGGPTLFQDDLVLEAVGLETDGSIKPIDQLSYTPAAGWANTSLVVGMPQLSNKNEALAIKSVFRWYRPKIRAGFSLLVGTVGHLIRTVDEILPLFSEQVESYTDLLTGRKRRKPAEVFGTFYLHGINAKGHANSQLNEIWKDGFTILGEIGVVEFPVLVRRQEFISGTLPFEYPEADLKLRTSFFARKDLIGGEYQRINLRVLTSPPLSGTGDEIVDKQDEIQLQEWRFTSSGGTTFWSNTRTLDDLDTKLQHYADAALLKYQLTNSGEDNYAGIVPTDLDGAIQQVTYSIGPDGAETLVGRNREPNPFYPSFSTRRRVEQSKQAAKEARKGEKESIRNRHEQKGVRV